MISKVLRIHDSGQCLETSTQKTSGKRVNYLFFFLQFWNLKTVQYSAFFTNIQSFISIGQKKILASEKRDDVYVGPCRVASSVEYDIHSNISSLTSFVCKKNSITYALQHIRITTECTTIQPDEIPIRFLRRLIYDEVLPFRR